MARSSISGGVPDAETLDVLVDLSEDILHGLDGAVGYYSADDISSLSIELRGRHKTFRMLSSDSGRPASPAHRPFHRQNEMRASCH